MNIRITADSTCDLNAEYLAEHSIVDIIPLRITMGGRDYIDGVDLKPEDIFHHVESGGELPKTSAVNMMEYREKFETLLKQCDAVIHFNIGDSFSSCYANAMMAAENLPVYVVNSQNLSTGIATLLTEAVDMIEAGCEDPKTIVDHVCALREKVDASFILNRLDYLHKGGRCSAVAMLGANMLHLRPCIEVVEGKMIVGKKFRGNYERCLKQYVADRMRNPETICGKRVFIAHTGVAPEMVKQVVTQVESIKHFDEVLEVSAGCSITSHCGENTVGVFFIRE